MTTQTEQKWQTADNQIIPFSEVTHQHWSNIYWYHLIFQRMSWANKNIMQRTVDLAKKEIEKRFDGVILEWRPIFDFEINWLNILGMLGEGTAIKDYDGKKIGNILTGPIRRTSIL
jgi:hypothetical protein